jgi:hypothetical protein
MLPPKCGAVPRPPSAGPTGPARLSSLPSRFEPRLRAVRDALVVVVARRRRALETVEKVVTGLWGLRQNPEPLRYLPQFWPWLGSG